MKNFWKKRLTVEIVPAAMIVAVIIFAQLIANAMPVIWDGGHATVASWSEATNWDGDRVPSDTDDVLFDATSTDSMYLDASGHAKSLRAVRAYTGFFNCSKATCSLYVANTCSLDVGGKMNLNGTVVLAGDSNIMVNAQSTFSAYRGLFVLKGNNTLNFLKSGATCPPVDCAYPSKTTTLGTTFTLYNDVAAKGNLITNGGTVTLLPSVIVTFDREASGKCINQLVSTTFTGGAASSMVFRGRATAVKDTLSNTKFTTSIPTIDFTTNGTGIKKQFYIVDTASFGAFLRVYSSASGSADKITLDINKPITINGNSYTFGASKAADSCVINQNSSVDVNGLLTSNSFNAGKTVYNQNASQINVTGNVTWATNTNLQSGTGTLILDGTNGTQTVTSNNALYYDVQKTGASIAVNADDLRINGDLTVSAGKLATGDSVFVVGDLQVSGVARLDMSGDPIRVGAMFSIASTDTLTTDATSKIYTADGASIYFGTKSLPAIFADGTTHWYDGGTVADYTITSTVGDSILGEIGKRFSCTSCDTADLNGADGAFNVFLSSSAGIQDSLWLPLDLSYSYTKWRDINAKNRWYINNGTNVNLGNLDP